MEKVRFGIIGIGNQGSYYNLSLFDKGAVPHGVVTAMCDVDEGKIAAMKQKTANAAAKYFTDYRQMLDSGLVDAALVVVPHYGHTEIVRECLARGVAALCDKPAGVYAGEVRKMNEFARKQKALFGMMFNQRTNGAYRKMRELVAAGELGALRRVVWVITNWYRTQRYYDSGDWRATWAGEGGGVLINQCPHQLDLLQWVVGEMPKRVRAFCHYGKWHDIEVEDDVTAYLEYEGGATGVFVTTTGEYPGVNRLEISGDRGTLRLENDRLTFIRLSRGLSEFTKNSDLAFSHPDETAETIETGGSGTQHAGVIENFAAAVLGKEKLFVPGEDGLNGVILMNAMELSGFTGETVELPLDDARYEALLRSRAAASRVKEKTAAVVSDTAGTF